MNRREFVVKGVSVPVASALTGSAPKAARHPNVLYVFSDEHRRSSMPGEEYCGVIAPTLEKFSKDNLTLRNCISNYPVCSPYRGILMSGRWPYQSGIIDNSMALAPNCGSLGEAFRSVGYDTSYIGKWHLSLNDNHFIPAGPARQGFADWHVWANTNPHFDSSFTFNPDTGARIQPRGYNATLMTDTAVDYIRTRKPTDEKPWMMVLSWNPPHPPFGDSPQSAKDLYADPQALALRPNVNLKQTHSKALKNNETLHEMQRNYFAHVSAIDAEFARLLRVLEETGQADNTIVVYTSDHGEMMGSHGYMDKRLPWEESCNVPFVVRYPGKTPRGKTSDVLFAAVDIFPTLCGLAGVPVPEHCVGRDLSAEFLAKPLARPLGKPMPKPSESVFLMHISKDRATGGEENAAPLFRGIRTTRYTYAVANDGRWMFYDNQEDPLQQHNLVTDAKAVPKMKELDGEILAYLKASGDPFDYASRLDSLSVHHTE